MTILKANERDLPVLIQLASRLWPHHSPQELEPDLRDTMAKADAAFFLVRYGENAVGFAQCQLRRDYVEGTENSPVGYLEGIYVEPAHRKMGVATALLGACQQWAKARGCAEFASDCELDNVQSLRFHLGVGFREANRIICFVKKL